ncbi:hypothetical protein ACFU98_29170 [Streptomyces sp. NPDC057575]|uniref:hypothetical protein n=1 Tax=unclassified Streptomyces TaxID=2593676 RepID=UPI00369F5B9A
MRKRGALLSLGITAMAVIGLSAPSAQAADWTYIGLYASKSRCVDAGQQYQREGWSEWKCTNKPDTSGYWLYVR